MYCYWLLIFNYTLHYKAWFFFYFNVVKYGKWTLSIKFQCIPIILIRGVCMY